MVRVTGNNRIRRSSLLPKGGATNKSTIRLSFRSIQHPQTWIVVTVGIAVLILYRLEPKIVYGSENAEDRLLIPHRSMVESFRGDAVRTNPSPRRPQQPSGLSASRFGMVPKSSLRTSILHPVDTLYVQKNKKENPRIRTVIEHDILLHTSEEGSATDDDHDDDGSITVTPSTFFPPRVVHIVEWYANRPALTPSSWPNHVVMAPITPLPLDPTPAVHFDVLTSNTTSESSTAKQKSFPFEREFLEDCEPVRNPQVHPTCNHLHELPMHDDQTTLLSTKGSWRTAWTVNNNTSVLKVLQYSRSFDAESFERHALDVIVSDQLTASPYIINAYGFCGQSIIQEWAPSGGRDVVKSYDIRNRQRLKIARDLARGLADLQALQVIPHETYKDGTLTRRHIPPPPPLVFSHNDINIANTIYSDSRQVIKWNDFNIGVFLRTRKGSNFTQDCGAPVKFRADLWRSPEEVRNTSYVQLPYTDMYGFGNILYQVMTRHQPWTHKEPEGQLTVAQVAERKREGRLPTMPEKYLNTTSKDLQIMVLATMSCYHPIPTKRLTAYEMAHALSYLYDRLQQKQPVPFSMLQEFFWRK